MNNNKPCMVLFLYIKFNHMKNSDMGVTPREYLSRGLREDYFGVLGMFCLYRQRSHGCVHTPFRNCQSILIYLNECACNLSLFMCLSLCFCIHTALQIINKQASGSLQTVGLYQPRKLSICEHLHIIIRLDAILTSVDFFLL